MQPLATVERSATNEPEVRNATLSTAGEPWSLRFDARFANSCLADAGIEVEYLTVPSPSGEAATKERMVLVRQAPTPLGCPEIYQPVLRRYAAEVEADRRVRRTWLINDAQAESELQMRSLPLEPPESGEPDTGGRERVRATALPDPPLVGEVTVRRELMPDEREVEYVVHLDVLFADRCRFEAGAEASVLESRTGVSDRTGGAVIDWLLLLDRGASTCAGPDPGAPVRARYQIKRRVHADYDRKLVLLNAHERPPSDSRPFSVFDVWPEVPPK